MAVNSREKIIGKIRKALNDHKLEMPFPEADKAVDFFEKEQISAEEKFAKEFSILGGKFVYCADETEMFQQLQMLADTMKWSKLHARDNFLLNLFRDHSMDIVQQDDSMVDIEVGISLCEALVARTGSVLLSSGQDYGRALPVYAPIHITIAFANQLVWDISDSIRHVKDKYTQIPSLLSLTTGPSRTADIEKTLVVGVHGPKEVYVFFIDKNWKKN